MSQIRKRYFNARKSYADYFKETHDAGALDVKTKELMHLALVLALHCEP
jgi:alkylhydroperoxidase/carboxymuconolactone decarboxylase family protein YurZ